MNRVETIRKQLNEALAPGHLDIEDDSHKHAGHAGAASGAGHFNVVVVSERFSGESMIARHQMVYRALANLMPSEIHALSIKALAPDEHTSVKT